MRSKLLSDLVMDPVVRDNMRSLEQYLSQEILLNAQWRLIEISFTGNISNFTYRHKLGFKPTDVIETSRFGTGSIAYNYQRFTDEVIDLTTSGTSSSDPLIVRFLVGRLKEDP